MVELQQDILYWAGVLIENFPEFFGFCYSSYLFAAPAKIPKMRFIIYKEVNDWAISMNLNLIHILLKKIE